MTSNERIFKIIKRLENHEERIKYLEEKIKGGKKKAHTGRISILNHLIQLKSNGFFNKPQSTKVIQGKLAQEGYHYPQHSLTEPLQRTVRQGILGRIKIKEGKKITWAYCKR